MFAIAAAVLFLIGAFVPDGDHVHSTTFWLLLGLAAIAAHIAYPIVVRRK